MNKRICLLLFLLLVYASPSLGECDKSLDEPLAIKQLREEVKLNKYAIDVIQRDKLNYRIEKEILEKAFSSNIETLNLVFVLILGFFTLFGAYLLKSLGKLHQTYSDGINDYKEGIKDLENQKKQFLTDIDLIKKEIRANEEQKRRVQILEITQKAYDYLLKNDFKTALTLSTEGLLIDPENLSLLDIKRNCLLYFGQLDASLEISKFMVNIPHEPHQMSVLTLLESLAFMKDSEEFERSYQKYKNELTSDVDQLVMFYLRSILSITTNNTSKVKEVLSELLDNMPDNGFMFALDKIWPFAPVNTFITKVSSPKEKEALDTLVSFFVGKINIKQLKDFLSAVDN